MSKTSISAIAAFMWVSGIILAKGFWMTLFAVFVPLYGWFKIVTLLLQHFGAAT